MSDIDEQPPRPGTVMWRAQELAAEQTGGYPWHDLRQEDRDHFIDLAIDEEQGKAAKAMRELGITLVEAFSIDRITEWISKRMGKP